MVTIMVSIRDWDIKSYQDAAAVLPKRENYLGYRTRKLGYETRLLEHHDGTISVVHHATPIVTYFPDGTVEVNTRGWRSMTTKERINLFSPIRVYQRQFRWYLWDGTPYEDGIRVYVSGAGVA